MADNCEYIIGEKTIYGPLDIAKSYEDNMIEGRKKLDKLEWGECRIEDINDSEYYVHFTDHLTHQSKEYIHKCKQKVTVGDNNKIIKIEHIPDPEEQARLTHFYQTVGLK